MENGKMIYTCHINIDGNEEEFYSESKLDIERWIVDKTKDIDRDKIIGALITKQYFDEDVTGRDIFNLFSHFQNDKSNWVTVGDVATFLLFDFE